jgi:hypothetical protein
MIKQEGFLEKGRKAFWPDVSTIEGAQLAVKYGWIVSYLVACITTVSALVGWISISSLFDAVIFLIIGYGIFRNSRIASIIGLVVFAFELLYKMREGKSLGIGIIILFYFINGVRGTLAYYRLKKVDHLNLMKDMVDEKIERLRARKQEIINEGARRGDAISTEKILEHLDALKASYQGPSPEQYFAEIDKAKQTFREKYGASIPVDEAYKIVTDYEEKYGL